MTRFRHSNGVGIFEYPDFASDLRDQVRAAAAGATIEHIAKSRIRKESVVTKLDFPQFTRPSTGSAQSVATEQPEFSRFHAPAGTLKKPQSVGRSG